MTYVRSVTVYPHNVEMEPGTWCTDVYAYVDSKNDCCKEVTWSSSDCDIATVSPSGHIYAVSEGTAVIKATAIDGSGKYDSVTVTVKRKIVLVNDVYLDSGLLNLHRGKEFTITATVLPSNADNKTLRWQSSNANVASVNNGVVTAKSDGYTVITAWATDGSGLSDCCEVYVTTPVTDVTVSPSQKKLNKGQTVALTATVSPANATDKKVKWSTSDSSIASVDSNGLVRAVNQGTAYITATSQDNRNIADCCEISVVIPVTDVSITYYKQTMKIGQSDFFTASVTPSNATNKELKWTTSDASIVSVNPSSGQVRAQKGGSAWIMASATDGSGQADCRLIEVDSTIDVQDVNINYSAITLTKGSTCTLKATVSPSNATNKNVRWESSNQKVATVSAAGKVTAVSVGQATVRAISKADSSIQDCCKVSVTQIKTDPQEYEGDNKVSGSTFADPVDVYTGAHTLTNHVMTLYGGQGLKFTAYYDSTKLSSGDLGVGWYHNFEKYLEITGCEARVYTSPSVYCRYTSDDGVTFTCTAPNRRNYILTVDHSQTYPYTLDCNLEYTEYYNSKGDLAKIVDHQGFETLIDNSGYQITVTDTVSGKKMYLQKNTDCRISKVYDDNGRQATFRYSGDRLVGICDLNGNSLTYTYNEDGQILTGTDSQGTCYFTNTYDDCGRVIRQKDGVAGSIASTFAYNDNGQRVTTDRNGNQSTRVFNSDGLLVRHTDENGNTKTYAYNTAFNVTCETDANGNKIEKVYNYLDKPTTITDKNGNKTYISYDLRGNVIQIRYPAVGGVVPEETFAYNSRNQLTEHTDMRGTVTVYTYDAQGMPQSKKVGGKNAIVYSYQDGLLVSQTDAMGNTTQYGYNAIGQMTSKTDADGNKTLYEYDACGNLLKTTDANGKTIVNTYDGNHQKTAVTDANGNKTEYSYNGNMKNTVITLPDGTTIQYEYDGEDRPVKMIDQAGNITTMQYDAAGRIISKRFPDSGVVSYEYDDVGNVVKETNPKGAITTKTYDALGNVLSVTDDDGNITRYQYDALSRAVRTVNAASGTTVCTYSPAGDLLCETDAFGHKKSYTYDAYGNRLTATDAKGNVTTYTYDDNNNLLTVKDPLNHVTTYTYNCLNQLVSVKDAKNNVVTYGYDALGRRTTVTDAKNNVFTTTYDGNGNVLTTKDAKGNTIRSTVYNSRNLPVKVTNAAKNTTTYTYTPLGKVESITAPLNSSKTYSYNSRGLNTAVRDANNQSSTATYDVLGNVTKLSGPLGGSTTYTYDAMGRLDSESTTSGGTVRYSYNELNVKEQVTNARGQVRKYFHDAMGRITGFVGAEDSVGYTYDANGNVLTVTDKNGTITREYDALNRVTKYTDTFGNVIQYEYDAVGNLSRMVYPDNTAVTYTYDANNNLLSVTDWANRTTTYTYDVNNKVTRVMKPDGSVTTTMYDFAQRVTSSVEKTAGGDVITGYKYSYDALGRIADEIDLAENTQTCYTYDKLSRVTKRIVRDICDCCVISEETFEYDAAGNITGGNIGYVEYDINNRLQNYNRDSSIDYDCDGNMLSVPLNWQEASFEYDSANRLVKAGGNTYTYNAEDVRIRNLCGNDNTTYVYNVNNRLSQLLMKKTNGVVTKYVYGLGLIGQEKAGWFLTYHFDYRGSTVAITNPDGYITDTFAYDTYGKVTERTGSTFVIFGYNGRDGVVTDRNGLLYMRARYYSPEHRRFVNADVIPGEISNAITLNRYAYANGNPVSNVDPFGLSAERGSSNWYGAAYLEQYSVETVESKDLLNIIDLVKVSYTQTVTTTKVHGTQGEWFGAYAYTDVSLDDLDNADYGVGLDFFYLLGLDINVKAIGIEVKGSLHFESTDVYISGEINLLDYSKIAVGITKQQDDTTQIDHQYSIQGNTWFVVGLAISLLSGIPVQSQPQPQPSF